jgi:hypothetical protein
MNNTKINPHQQLLQQIDLMLRARYPVLYRITDKTSPATNYTTISHTTTNIINRCLYTYYYISFYKYLLLSILIINNQLIIKQSHPVHL